MTHTGEGFWNYLRSEKLAIMWREGKTTAEIAEAIGGHCTRNQVIGRARRMNLGTRQSPIKKNSPGRPKKEACPKPSSLSIGTKVFRDDGSHHCISAGPWPEHARFDGARMHNIPSNPVFVPAVSPYSRSEVGNAAAMCAEMRGSHTDDGRR
jgi:hypothetical protein